MLREIKPGYYRETENRVSIYSRFPVIKAYAGTFSNITPGEGAGFELNAIGAAIIGGTAMTGGSGSIFGAFLGVLLISLLQVGLPFIGLNANWQLLVTGCILMGAVAIDKLRKP